MRNIIFAWCVFFSSPSLAVPMTENEFTDFFMRQAANELQDFQFQIVRPLQLNSKNVNDHELTIFLSNAFFLYNSNPERLRLIVQNQINAIKTQNKVIDSKIDKSIFAVVKSAEYIENIKTQLYQAGLSDNETPLIYEKINDELYAFFVFDTDHGMRFIEKKVLAEIGIDQKAVRSIAIKNLAMHFEAKGVEVRRLEGAGHAKVYSVSLDENYESSILLLKKFWTKDIFDVAGDIVAFVPARNMVIVTGSEEDEGMRIARYLANRGYRELGYAISPNGYKYNAGTWKPYML